MSKTIVPLVIALMFSAGCGDANRSPVTPSPIGGSPRVVPVLVGPRVTAITPNAGGTNGATLIRILGSDLQGTSAISFGGVGATRVGWAPDGTVLYATTPAGGAGPVDVVITNRQGQVTTLSAAFTYGAAIPLGVTEIAPNTGAVAGGTYVTIKGAGFQFGATVMVGGIDAHLFYQSVDGAIAISAPPHARQAVDVVVTNPDGQRVTIVDGYRYAPSPFTDFNGDWEGHSGDEGETPLRFSIRDGIVISVTCGVDLLNVPAVAVSGGDWQLRAAGASRMTAALVRADYAEGMTNIPQCSSYDAPWFATRR